MITVTTITRIVERGTFTVSLPSNSKSLCLFTHRSRRTEDHSLFSSASSSKRHKPCAYKYNRNTKANHSYTYTQPHPTKKKYHRQNSIPGPSTYLYARAQSALDSRALAKIFPPECPPVYIYEKTRPPLSERRGLKSSYGRWNSRGRACTL